MENDGLRSPVTDGYADSRSNTHVDQGDPSIAGISGTRRFCLGDDVAEKPHGGFAHVIGHLG